MSQTIVDINPSLTPKQKEALRLLFDFKGEVNEILYGGAAGGGKTYLGCLWLIISCLRFSGTRWLIGRSKLTTLKKTTLKTFFEVCGKLGLKETLHYKYNQVNNEIKFYNGSEIILKDLFLYPSDSEFDSLGSLEISGAFIDECNQISEKAKNIVMSRIRFKLDEFELIPKLLMTCNPARNWVYNEYYKKNIDGRLEPYKRFIPALNTDNQYITKHYVTGLKRQDEVTKRRLLYGDWDYQDELSLFKYDAILDMFEDSIYDIEPKIDGKAIFSIDVARLGKDKTCIIVWDELNIIEIKEISKLRMDEQKVIIQDMMKKYKVENRDLIFDTDGVGGGLADMFRGCVEIVNNSRALNDENYQNLKTQLYYKLAEQINSGQIKVKKVTANQKMRMIQELQIIKRESADQDGKIKMTNKEQMKVQIGRSPDISDAMAFRMHTLIKKRTGTDFSFSFIDIGNF